VFFYLSLCESDFLSFEKGFHFYTTYSLNFTHTYVRYAVAFYYPHSSWSALQSIPWSGRYVFDDDIIRYVSIENRKSGSSSAETTVNAQGESETNKDVGPSILVHTSVPFGIQHKNSDEIEVYKMIQDHLDMVLPNLGRRIKQNRTDQNRNNKAILHNFKMILAFVTTIMRELWLIFFCFFCY
jgi:hypothetical protein